MVGIERRYLRECVQALYDARFELLRLSCEESVGSIRYGKADTLRLDAIPEIMIHQTLCKEFDPHLPLITEEMGSNVKLRGTEEEVVCFSDPMDRTNVLRDFLVKNKNRWKSSLNDFFVKKI